MDIVIQGAGIAGCALALMLARQGHSISVIERAPSLRGGGHAIDVRGAALDVVREMGLIEPVRACRTRFRGMSICDANDHEIERTEERTFGGGSPDGPDIELFRDDLARILADAIGEGVAYIFEDEVAALQERSDCLDLTFRSGATRRCDLLVGADGLRSAVRRLVFGPDSNYVRPLGIFGGIYSAPNRIGLHDWQLVFQTPERGMIMYPTRANDALRVALYFANGAEVPAQDVPAQKRALTERFGDVGGRFGVMLNELHTAEDLYASEMAQVHMSCWSAGRVVLVGDAAHCPSPLTGQGTSVALVGAYLLADAIANSDGDLKWAASRYEDGLRPFATANLAINLQTGEGIDAAKNAIIIGRSLA